MDAGTRWTSILAQDQVTKAVRVRAKSHQDGEHLFAEEYGFSDPKWLIVKPDMDTYTFATSRQLDFPVCVKM